jgi:hypothetical protein
MSWELRRTSVRSSFFTATPSLPRTVPISPIPLASRGAGVSSGAFPHPLTPSLQGREDAERDKDGCEKGEAGVAGEEAGQSSVHVI